MNGLRPLAIIGLSLAILAGSLVWVRIGSDHVPLRALEPDRQPTLAEA